MVVDTKDADKGRWGWTLLSVACGLFLVFLGITAWNDRLNTTDDFLLLERLQERGPIGAIRTWEFNPRPVSHLVFHLTFLPARQVADLHLCLFVSHLLFLVLTVHALHRLLIEVFRPLGLSQIGRRAWTLAVTLLMCAFFFVFERQETWAWYIGSMVYLLPFLFLTYGLAFMLQGGRRAWWALPCCFLVGGTLELMVPITGLLLLALYCGGALPLRALLANGAMLIALPLVHLLGNGIGERLAFETTVQVHHPAGFFDIIKHLIARKNLFFLLLAIGLATLLGPHCTPPRMALLNKVLLYLGAVVVASLLLTWAVCDRIYPGSFGYARMWAPCSLLLMVWLLLAGVRLAAGLPALPSAIGNWAFVVFIVLFTGFAWHQLRVTAAYAARYDVVCAGAVDTDLRPVDSGMLISPGHFDALRQHLQRDAHE